MAEMAAIQGTPGAVINPDCTHVSHERRASTRMMILLNIESYYLGCHTSWTKNYATHLRAKLSSRTLLRQ